MMPAASGPRQMKVPTEPDAMHANRKVPLLLQDAAVVVVDVGRRNDDERMRPVHLVLVAVARDS